MKMLYLNIFILCSLLNIFYAEEDHDHDHNELSRSILIDEIAEHIDAKSKKGEHTVFVFEDIKTLFGQLSFQNCSKTLRSSKCNLCVTPEDVLEWFGHNYNKKLSEKELRELSVGLIYFLSEYYQKLNSVERLQNNSAVCKTFTKRILANKTSDLFNLYLRKYDAKRMQQLTEESLESILGNINKSIGHQLATEKCFTAHDVLNGVNVSANGFGEHDLEYVSTFIILKLIKKTCIGNEEHEEVHKPLTVSKDYFISELFEEFGNVTDGAWSMDHEGFERLYSKIFPLANATEEDHDGGHEGHAEEGGHDEHEGHDHRKRRSVESANKCHSAEGILEIFGVAGASLNKEKFQEICPSLVQQVESGVCKSTPTTKPGGESKKNKETWRPWIAAMISIAIISFGSLIGVVVFPGKEKKWFPYVIMFLIALGVSVLICDAILHLIPHALNLHGHEESGAEHAGHDEHEESQFKTDSYLWKCLLVLGGIYLFFTFEVLMHAFGRGHSHSHHGAHDHDHHEMEMGSPVSTDSLKVVPSEMPTNPEDVVISNDYTVKYKNGVANGGTRVAVSNGHTPQEKRFTVKDVKSIAWMILIGDGIHNFMDGVAIGVAFSEPFPAGLHGGISTSIAILCHEIPHELSDFAVLIASGLTIKQSLIMNMISSLTAFAGGIVGVSLGTNWDAAPWIFSVTAGLFIYIALVDMLPEIMNSPLLKKTPAASIAVDTMGLSIGLVIMFVLAAWEEDIKNAWN